MEKSALTPDMCRLLFTVLCDSAMRFREMYFRDDIESMKASTPPPADALRSKGARMLTQKAVNKAHNDQLKKFELGMRSINERIYREVKAAKERAGEDKAKMIDALVDHFTICAEEIITAKDMRQTAMLLKLNNQGFFSEMFNQLEKDKNEQAAKETEPSAETPTDIQP